MIVPYGFNLTRFLDFLLFLPREFENKNDGDLFNNANSSKDKAVCFGIRSLGIWCFET